MIDYEENWFFLLLFRLKGSVIIRASYFAVPSAFLAVIVLTLDIWFPELRKDTQVVDITESQLWSASTVVLLVLLSFRTNRAMARFWEGTGLLHQMRGEWFDSVSCCVTFSRAANEARPIQVREFRHTIVRLMSLCHGSALAEIAGAESDAVEMIDAFGLSNATLQYLKEAKQVHRFNRVEVLLHLIQSLITKGYDDEILMIPPPILSRVYQTLSRGFVNLLNAKKIADTRFPFPYAQLIAILLLLHIVLTPLLITALIKSRVWASIFTFVTILGIFALNFIGVELENPFGDDDNDLPLDHFQSEMNTCLLMLLQDGADMIPGVSNHRCVFDFQSLEDSVRKTIVEPGERRSRAQERKRLSQFASFLDLTADDNPQSGMSDSSRKGYSLCSISQFSFSDIAQGIDDMPLFPNQDGLDGKPYRLSMSDLLANPSGGPIMELPQAVEAFNAALSRWTSVIATQVVELSRMFGAVAKDPNVSIEPLAHSNLHRGSLDRLGGLLEQWTKMIDDQAGTMQDSFVALKGFSDHILTLLDTDLLADNSNDENAKLTQRRLSDSIDTFLGGFDLD